MAGGDVSFEMQPQRGPPEQRPGEYEDANEDESQSFDGTNDSKLQRQSTSSCQEEPTQGQDPE